MSSGFLFSSMPVGAPLTTVPLWTFSANGVTYSFAAIAARRRSSKSAFKFANHRSLFRCPPAPWWAVILHGLEKTVRFGRPLATARGAIFLLHGRGGSPRDIAGLAAALPDAGLAFAAPAAHGSTWYPNRFLVPTVQNEPWLSSALAVVGHLIDEALAAGLTAERLGFIGFSQGACLALEYAARHGRRYGFVAGLSGALIGPIDAVRPRAELQGTPVLLGCAEADPHIPVDYVEQSAALLESSGAQVSKQIYPGSDHSVFPEEIEWLQQQVSSLPWGQRKS